MAAGSDAAAFSFVDQVTRMFGIDRPAVQIMEAAPSAAFATPTVTTNPRTALRRTSATLNGKVTANGESTTVTFEYGLTTAYGNTVTATQSPVAYNGVDVPVSFPLAGVLTPSTTYHFRAVGTNGSGTTYGLDSSFTTPAAGSTTYYVDKTNGSCSDALTGAPGTSLVPFCSINRALGATGTTTVYADAGDTVRVVNGTYAETVKWDNNNGGVGMPLTLSAAPGVTVTGLAAGNGFQITSHSFVVVDGFTVSNTDGYGIYAIASNHLTISNNHVTSAGTPTSGNTRAGIYVYNTTDSLITGNTSDHNSSHGILLTSGASNNTVSNNVSFGNASEVQRDACGINLVTNSNYNTIIHNTVYANEDTGLNFYSGSHDNVVVGNLTYGNADHGIDNNAAPNQIIVGNTVHGNVTVGINVEGGTSPGSGGAMIKNNIMMDNGLRLAAGGQSAGQPGNLRVDAQSLVGTTLDHNLYYLNTGTEQIQWNNTSYASLAAFTAAQPTQEIHGLQSNPLFVAPAPIAIRPNVDQPGGLPAVNVGDYHLTAGSAAIDSANSDAPNEPTLDIAGNPRVDDPATANTGAGTRTYDDRGAYEYQPPATFLLSVTKAGSGSGTVTSDPAGINCGTDCSHNFAAATIVTLTAAVAPGSTFVGWSDSGCSGTGTCVVTMDAAKSVTATFARNEHTLTTTVVGYGVVNRSIAGPYYYGDVVTLTAVPGSTHWTFAGFSGDLTGTTNPQDIAINGDKSVSATFVLLPEGYEADVNPRPMGDNVLQDVDCTMTGRFAAGLETPDPLYNEFQRADSAPRATRGDGSIDVGDYVQAGRYANSLDPWTEAGGGTLASIFPFMEITNKQQAQDTTLLPRVLRAVDVSTSPGSQVTVSINIDAEGDENGFGFTVSYDGTKLSMPFVTTGADMPGITPIVNTITAGKVGVITAWSSGSHIPAGTREVVKIRFNVSPTAPAGQTPIVFTGFPSVVNKVVDALAGDLPTTFATGNVNILRPTAANTSVGGIVLSAEGMAISRARLTLTDPSGLTRTAISNSFGFFRFDDVAVGETYIITVRAKEYTFTPRVLNVTDEVTNLNLVAEP